MVSYVENPSLISICVITYNSSKFVVETLESAKSQTYNNIELIISDDCSTDNTVEICKEWIKNNEGRFKRTELITVEKNTGVPANCNRGIKAAHSKWLKLIAGDDLLMPNCIELGVNFISLNPDTKIFASKAILFNNENGIDKGAYCNSENMSFFSELNTSKMQFNLLKKSNVILAPTVFISKKLWIENSGFDEGFLFMEDFPFWIKTLKKGIKIDFMNSITVAYRYHSDSISKYEQNKLFNAFYIKDYQFRRTYMKNDYTPIEFFNISYAYYVKILFDKLKWNNKKYKLLFLIILRLNILKYIKSIQ